MQIAKDMGDDRIRVYRKDHSKFRRGKNDSVYLGAHLSNNENILILDCDTLVEDTTDAIDKLYAGNDIVGIIIEIIPDGTLLSKCEQIEYSISIGKARPWLYKNLHYLNNVSGAGFGIKRRCIIENRIPDGVIGEDMTYTQIGLIKKWKIALSSSVVKTYATPGLKALFIQRNRWVNGYYTIIRFTKRYVPLIESVTIYYRTLVTVLFLILGGSITSHFLSLTLTTLLIYFLNEYRFVRSIKYTIIMMVYRQINFVSALTFWKYGRVWKVIRKA